MHNHQNRGRDDPDSHAEFSLSKIQGARPGRPELSLDTTMGYENDHALRSGRLARMSALLPRLKPGPSGSPAAELVQVLRSKRTAVADTYAQALLQHTTKWKPREQEHRNNRAELLANEFHVFADYLIEYFARGDEIFRHLLAGESIKALYDPALDSAAAREQSLEVLTDQRRRLRLLLDGTLTPDAQALLDNHLSHVTRTLTAPAPKTQHVLFVGDCLFIDIVAYTVGDLLDAGIRLVPDYAAYKNPAMLHEQLRALSSKKFDLVFFSPFSYKFSLHYGQIKDWRNAMAGSAELDKLVQDAWKDTQQTIDLLADLFDCPIHVHNAAGIVREEHPLKRLLKQKATRRIRAVAKRRLNELVAEHLQRKNAESYQHLYLIDEDRVAQKHGEFVAGQYFYMTPLQHPAMLGRILAPEYVDRIYVNAWLAKRKVVVCDLDNTLWDGVIGEGAIVHCHDRQAVLKQLKQKGVVLAINSKNDPANVHWRGGTLDDDDFVCAAISWNPKVQGMKRIQDALNLKTKDYVFIDDREDEREMVRMTYPEILCLDPTDPVTWRRFALWEQQIEADCEMDRTLMYKQREQRKAFIKDDPASDEERARMFATLELKLTIAPAKPADLKRVAELINRTNQFNLEGSRTSFKEVGDWHDSPDHLILLGQSSDRFGDMGTTCVAVVHLSEGEMRLLPFVLSCRVFGYGIEHAMMNHLKGIARQRGARRIVGRYEPTPQNAPCKSFLPDNGFAEQDGTWVCAPDHAIPNPGWLRVETS